MRWRLNLFQVYNTNSLFLLLLLSRPTDSNSATQANPLTAQPNSNSQENLENLNLVVWSAWSQWSSCVDKNGFCDSSRLHSRLRTCVAQHTGEKVDATQCKQRFNMHDQELEVADCSKSCNQQQQQQQQAAESHIMSDAPSVIGPQTAPSVLVNNEPSMMPTFLAANSQQQQQNNNPKMSAITSGPSKEAQAGSQAQAGPVNLLDVYTSVSSPASINGGNPSSTSSQQLAVGASPSSIPSTDAESGLEIIPSSTPTLMPQMLANNQQQQMMSQMSCSNCTSDEICLLLMQQKVPFCAKIKDRTDESGCGGWCKAKNQLCLPGGGQNSAFKCIHDSECLAEEWRCHDSACIPLSKRCDGHANCYDSSDERDCWKEGNHSEEPRWMWSIPTSTFFRPLTNVTIIVPIKLWSHSNLQIIKP